MGKADSRLPIQNLEHRVQQKISLLLNLHGQLDLHPHINHCINLLRCLLFIYLV
jgi:hypothetical protein